jgi:glycosyltransferase involved in cell wall biosynthesis
LVTVICITYNHALYVSKAIESVWRQSYEPIELIVIDDFSTDETVLEVERLQKIRDFLFIKNKKNLGYCKTFNHAFSFAKGQFIVDLSGDDVLLPHRIMSHVEILKETDAGVIYSNCLHIASNGQSLSPFHVIKDKQLSPKPHEGFIFPNVLGLNFISTPTMTIRREVLEYTQGYDESIAFEDFDFWLKSAKKFRYVFDKSISTQKRIINDSLSTQFYKVKNSQMYASLAKVLFKEADPLWATFVKPTLLYYLKLACATENFFSILRFMLLCRKYQVIDSDKIGTCKDRFWLFFAGFVFRHRIRLNGVYILFSKIKHRLSQSGV